jgi:hypothetical protein
MAHRDPDLFTQLIDRLADATGDYLEAQIEAGARGSGPYSGMAGIRRRSDRHGAILAREASVSLQTYWLVVPLAGIGLSLFGWLALWLTRDRGRHSRGSP